MFVGQRVSLSDQGVGVDSIDVICLLISYLNIAAILELEKIPCSDHALMYRHLCFDYKHLKTVFICRLSLRDKFLNKLLFLAELDLLPTNQV